MTTIVTRVNKTSELTYLQGDDNIDLDIHTEAMPYTADIDDNRTVIQGTGTGDFTLPDAATIVDPAGTFNNDWQVTIKNAGVGVITVKTQGTDTLDLVAASGDKEVAVGEAFTYKVNTAENGYLSIAKVSANATSSSAVIADDVLIKGDGGVRGVQGTGITVADTTNNTSGMGTLGCDAITSTSTIQGTTITATANFAGNITGNVTGNVSGTAATVTGATQAAITACSNLVTVGALNSGSITSGFGSINNGASAITTTGVVSAGSLTLTTDLTVPNGGTGVSSLAIHGVLVGNAANAVSVAAVGTTGQVLTGVTGADPAFATPVSKTMLTATDANSVFSAGATLYTAVSGEISTNATENIVKMLVPISGTVSDLYVQFGVNDVTATTVVTVRYDNAPTALTTNITTGSTAIATDLVNSFPVVAGHYISVGLAMGGTGTTSSFFRVSMVITH